jgi:hypothetical protein
MPVVPETIARLGFRSRGYGPNLCGLRPIRQFLPDRSCRFPPGLRYRLKGFGPEMLAGFVASAGLWA